MIQGEAHNSITDLYTFIQKMLFKIYLYMEYNKTSLNRNTMRPTLNDSFKEGGQLWELKYCYNGIVSAIV